MFQTIKVGKIQIKCFKNNKNRYKMPFVKHLHILTILTMDLMKTLLNCIKTKSRPIILIIKHRVIVKSRMKIWVFNFLMRL